MESDPLMVRMFKVLHQNCYGHFGPKLVLLHPDDFKAYEDMIAPEMERWKSLGLMEDGKPVDYVRFQGRRVISCEFVTKGEPQMAVEFRPSTRR